MGCQACGYTVSDRATKCPACGADPRIGLGSEGKRPAEEQASAQTQPSGDAVQKDLGGKGLLMAIVGVVLFPWPVIVWIGLGLLAGSLWTCSKSLGVRDRASQSRKLAWVGWAISLFFLVMWVLALIGGLIA